MRSNQLHVKPKRFARRHIVVEAGGPGPRRGQEHELGNVAVEAAQNDFEATNYGGSQEHRKEL